MKIKKIETTIFLLLLSLGIFLRLWRLGSLPNGIDGDVIITATNSLHIFNGTDFKVFQNNKIVGSPVTYLFWCMPLGSFLIALFLNIFKQAELGALFSSAFVGILTIPIIYLFVKKIAGTSIALLSTFFLVVSPYHLVYSRSGFTHITLIIPLVTLAIYFLYKAVEKNRIGNLYFCGIIWGLILFNSYPIAYIVGPITIIYLIWIGKWKWIFSKEFIISIFIAVITFLLYSIGFSWLNKYNDPLIVLKESYYQWIAVRLGETQQNTSLIKNIGDGIRILFWGIKPSYQFGVLRIFGYPMLDLFIGITFAIGFIASIIRRNKIDKLLILWVLLSFIFTSVINIPQERYLFVIYPIPYILCAMVVLSIININKIRKFFNHYRYPLYIILAIILGSYMYIVTYKQYFISYANNNANMIHGLGDGDVGRYLVDKVNPDTSMILSSIKLPGVELSTKFKYKNSLSWGEFINNIMKLSIKYYPIGISIRDYPEQSIEKINDGKIDTYWYGKTPGSILIRTNGSKISTILAFFSTLGPGRASSNYKIEYLDKYTNRWTMLKEENNSNGINGYLLNNLNLNTNFLRLNLKNTIAEDSLQMVEEICIFQKPQISEVIPFNIDTLILIMNYNPNYKYYGNYDERAKDMYQQANILLGGDIESKLDKTIYGNKGEVIYKIYSLKVKDLKF